VPNIPGGLKLNRVNREAGGERGANYPERERRRKRGYNGVGTGNLEGSFLVSTQSPMQTELFSKVVHL